MKELIPLIKDLTVMLGVASFFTLLFQKFRQPIVLAYLLSGLLIGPYILPIHLITDVPSLNTLSELGVIFLMFSLGLEFSFHKLTRVGMSAVLTGLFEVGVMFALGWIIGEKMHWSPYDRLFLAAALAISSTFIIVKTLDELGLKQRYFSELIVGILIVEDLLAILMLVGLTISVHKYANVALDLANATIKLVIVVGGWFLLGYFLIPPLMRKIVPITTQETTTILSVALCLSLTCLAINFGYSSALGAFIMGSILAETELIHSIEQFIKPLRDIFAAVFFISIGMRIDPHILITHSISSLLIALVMFAGKFLSTALGAFLTGQHLNTSLRVGFSMAQIGEFAFIIATLGLSLHVTSATLLPVIVAVSTLTTLITPYLIRFSGMMSKKMIKTLPASLRMVLDHYSIFIDRYLSLSRKRIPYGLYMMRLWINAVLVTIIFSMCKQWILPLLKPYTPFLLNINAATWLISFFISMPFIWGMLFSCMQLRKPRYFKSIAYTIRGMGWLFTLTVLSTISVTYFHLWQAAAITLSLASLVLILLYQPLSKFYYTLEKSLIRNIKSHQQQYCFQNELYAWGAKIIALDLSNDYSFINKSLQDLKFLQHYGCHVVAIVRGSRLILDPSPQEKIRLCDKLIFLGEDDAVALLTQTTATQEEFDLASHFALKTVLLGTNHSFVGYTLAELIAHMHAEGLVIGLERAHSRVLKPDANTRIEPGDRIIFLLKIDSMQLHSRG